MTKIQRRILTSLTLALGIGLGASSVAYADTAGSWGRVVSVRETAQGSDDYGRFRGELEIQGERDGKKPGPTETYLWGGSKCPGRDLSDRQVDQLHNALGQRGTLRILPYHKAGQGGAKCLVGFDIRAREAVKKPRT